MKVLFVCHANVCRSFMAQELLKHFRPAVQAFSRGLYADPDYVIPPKVFAFLQTYQIAPAPHVPTQLAGADLAAADYIFFMEQQHLDSVLDRFAQYTDKCYLLGEFVTGESVDLPDPIGLRGRAFDRQADVLARWVHTCAGRLA